MTKNNPKGFNEEQEAEQIAELSDLYRKALVLLGEDPQREGLVKTPLRVAKAMTFLTEGYQQDPVAVLRSAMFNESYDRMVIVKDIDFYSLCEHHLLPFYGKVHIAYLPDQQITGLSKLPRIVNIFSRRLQVQERLTREIRECIETALHPKGAIVMIEARHMCMQMRGVEKQDSVTVTFDYSEHFNSLEARQEFLRLIGKE